MEAFWTATAFAQSSLTNLHHLGRQEQVSHDRSFHPQTFYESDLPCALGHSHLPSFLAPSRRKIPWKASDRLKHYKKNKARPTNPRVRCSTKDRKSGGRYRFKRHTTKRGSENKTRVKRCVALVADESSSENKVLGEQRKHLTDLQGGCREEVLIPPEKKKDEEVLTTAEAIGSEEGKSCDGRNVSLVTATTLERVEQHTQKGPAQNGEDDNDHDDAKVFRKLCTKRLNFVGGSKKVSVGLVKVLLLDLATECEEGGEDVLSHIKVVLAAKTVFDKSLTSSIDADEAARRKEFLDHLTYIIAMCYFAHIRKDVSIPLKNEINELFYGINKNQWRITIDHSPCEDPKFVSRRKALLQFFHNSSKVMFPIGSSFFDSRVVDQPQEKGGASSLEVIAANRLQTMLNQQTPKAVVQALSSFVTTEKERVRHSVMVAPNTSKKDSQGAQYSASLLDKSKGRTRMEKDKEHREPSLRVPSNAVQEKETFVEIQRSAQHVVPLTLLPESWFKLLDSIQPVDFNYRKALLVVLSQLASKRELSYSGSIFSYLLSSEIANVLKERRIDAGAPLPSVQQSLLSKPLTWNSVAKVDRSRFTVTERREVVLSTLVETSKKEAPTERIITRSEENVVTVKESRRTITQEKVDCNPMARNERVVVEGKDGANTDKDDASIHMGSEIEHRRKISSLTRNVKSSTAPPSTYMVSQASTDCRTAKKMPSGRAQTGLNRSRSLHGEGTHRATLLADKSRASLKVRTTVNREDSATIAVATKPPLPPRNSLPSSSTQPDHGAQWRRGEDVLESRARSLRPVGRSSSLRTTRSEQSTRQTF